jgi:hypothetical protein
MRARAFVLVVAAGCVMTLGATAEGQARVADGIQATAATATTATTPESPSFLGSRCLRFDDLPAGSALTVYRGITFVNADGALSVWDIRLGSPFSSPNSVLPDNYSLFGNRTTAAPHEPVNGAMVTMGDYGSDEDILYLEAYDAAGNLIDSDTDVVPDHMNGGKDLTVSSDRASITSIVFWAVGSHDNSVYFDNVCFRS